MPFAWIQQLHPFHHDWRLYLRDALLAGGVVAFILTFFQPFSIDEIEGAKRWWVGAAFGGVTFGMMTLSYGWLLAFPRLFQEQKWTLGHEFLWTSYHFVTISAGNWWLGRYLFPESGLFQSYWPIFLITVMVGLLPYLLITYVSHNRYLRRHLSSATELESSLQQQADPPPAPSDPVLPLADEEALLPPIRLQQLLFIEAEGNYLRVWVEQNGAPTDYRLRGTLKEQEARLADFEPLLRCHRAFLVNLEKVQHVAGNSAGYRLTVHPSLAEVPVSRSKVEAFKAAFQRRLVVRGS